MKHGGMIGKRYRDTCEFSLSIPCDSKWPEVRDACYGSGDTGAASTRDGSEGPSHEFCIFRRECRRTYGKRYRKTGRQAEHLCTVAGPC